jgi:hypothetical protein
LKECDPKEADSLADPWDSAPPSVKERHQTMETYQAFKEKSQWAEFYRVFGMVFFVTGLYFLIVPFYNVIC